MKPYDFKYRPDIDGLRAIAVLPVVLFHADITLFSGGFVGVDIFFVISGYLITSILMKDLHENKFSMWRFWERRIRRILPALLAVILFCLITGWFLFLPQDYKNLGQQVFSQTFFSSNILFYLQSGYFDSANDTKPLLHTWSLAVEEQFYLFYPIGLFLLWRFIRKEQIKTVLICLFLLSFGLSIYGVNQHPSAAFYLLPTRAWELLAGALIVFLPRITITSKPLKFIIVFIGCLGVIVPIFLYNENTPFPGLAAFPPCIGAAALIWVHEQNKTIVSRILSYKPFIFTGLVSYSWYLWHWPFIVFTKYYFYDGAPTFAILSAVVLSFVASVLSWKYIEQPFRKKKSGKPAISISKIGISFACLLIIFPAIAFIIHDKQGLPARWNPDILSIASAEHDRNMKQAECNRPSLQRIKIRDICQTNPSEPNIDFVLWGDSHADAIAPLFYDLSREYKQNGYILTYDGCPPIIGVRQHNRESSFYCSEFNNAVLELIKSKDIQYVILVSSWNNWLDNKNLYVSSPELETKSVSQALYQTISALDVDNLYIMQTIPTHKVNPPQYLALKTSRDGRAFYSHELPYSENTDIRHLINKSVLYASSNSVINVLDPNKILCLHNNMCHIFKEGNVLYYNGGHLSSKGSQLLEPLFAPIFKKMSYEG